MRHDLTLQGGDLTLRPLTEGDIPALTALATDAGDELRHMGTPPQLPAGHWQGLDAPDQLPFVVLLGGSVVGSTRYGGLTDFSAEIGWTWLHPRLYGSGLNRRMKRLMLAHAFEEMGMARVQLKTDILNLRSQRAIEKLGAVREGVLRKHQRRADGTLRDTVMYSVTADEWPGVRAGLDAPPG